MTLGDRCDQVIALIDEVLGEGASDEAPSTYEAVAGSRSESDS